MKLLEETIRFAMGYHCILFLAMCCFIPLLKFRRNGVWSFCAFAVVYLGLPEAYLAITGNFLWVADFFRIGVYSCSFIIYWLALLALFYSSFKCSISSILFFGAASYAVQWFSVNAQSGIRYLLFSGQRSPMGRMVSLLAEAVILAAFYFVFVRRLQIGAAVNIDDRQLLAFLLLTLFSVNVFTQFWQANYISRAEGDIDTIEIYGSVFSLLVALLLLIVQFGLFEQTKLRQENAVMEQLLKNAEKQYKLSKQTIDVINRKCHDMRHQIRHLDMQAHQRQFFGEAAQAISIYSNIAQTGNEALDVVLTEKSLLCEENRIMFSCILNGADLSFMDAVDIYALFGNALDNAIESVVKCPDEERRIITVREQRRGGFINLTIENYCDGELEFSDGLPVTSKGDRDRHGFGTKSIKYIVEKYGGIVAMEKNTDCFTVRTFFAV